MNPTLQGAAAGHTAGQSAAPHPSYFLLDRLHLAELRRLPDAETDGVQAHVQDCERCRAYLRSLSAAASSVAPGWVTASRAGSRWARLWASLVRPAVLVPTLSALAVTLVLLGTRGLVSDESSQGTGPGPVTPKGGSGVQVYVKRGEQVLLWDGKAALQPHDRIRLEVAGGGFPLVTVATPAEGGGLTSLVPLYSGPLRPDVPTQLPASWTLDDRRGVELLYVILSEQPLPAGPLDLVGLRQRLRLAVHTLHVQKETRP